MTKRHPGHVEFPAAHSMDTTWFAVDRDGHVGVFESGEPGAVPKEVDDSGGQIDDAVEVALWSLPATGQPTFKLTAVFHPGFRPGILPRPKKLARGWPDPGGATLLLFRDESVLTSEVRTLPGLHVSRAGAFVFVSLMPDIELSQEDPRWAVWDEFKRTAGAGPSYVTSHTLYGPELSYARRGLFVHSAHHARFNIAEPYGRVLTPERPLTLDEAPAPVRDLLARRARLDISFASSPYVQPAELIPCVGWASEVYLASDGFTVRPFSGSVSTAYRDEAAVLLRSRSPRRDEQRYKPLAFDPPLNPDDFPAAHSMDATWFAVDRNGHVGLFVCGEEGAVPETEVEDAARQSYGAV